MFVVVGGRLVGRSIARGHMNNLGRSVGGIVVEGNSVGRSSVSGGGSYEVDVSSATRLPNVSWLHVARQ